MTELQSGARLQSSLGTNLTRANGNYIVDTLIIARVASINYQLNTVTFTPMSGSTRAQNASQGGNNAVLPMSFAGRNGYGRSYGEVEPIVVGDIILVGYVDSSNTNPIVIGRYPDAAIAKEVTAQRSPSYAPDDIDTYAQSHRKLTVYPDQTYSLHDGSGRMELTFSGNSFVLVNQETDVPSHATDDGDMPVNETNLAGHFDGAWEERTPLDRHAPEIVLRHNGTLDKDGNKDQHELYLYINQDGTYRTSVMNDDQDWRAYFEMTPDGKIRLRRQEDSKIFNSGSKSSELLIDENGYVTVRSQSSGLVVRPDGIYNLDGTKFTSDVDLSNNVDFKKVWDSIDETKDGIKENKAQIEISSHEIATKVSTDELPVAINNQLKPYDDSLKNLKDSYTDVQKTIDNLASDGVISGADKKAARTIWLQIQTEYPATIAQAEANHVDHTALDGAYTTLKSYLTPILLASGDTTIDSTEWDRDFSNYYNASYNVNTAIVAALRKLAQSGYDKAVTAAEDAGDAITQASEAASEDYLTGSDKATLGHVWIQIQNQYPNDVSSADAVKVDHSALDAAYNDLNAYIQTNNVFANNSTIPIDGETLANKIKAYFKQEASVLKQVADKNIQTLAEYGQDIDHQATSIKETSTKIALSAENIQKHNDSLAVMQGQLNVMANQISGGVSETDVTGIVNDSLSGTGLGHTNQFVLKTATKGQYMDGNNGSSSASANGIISDYIAVTVGTPYSAKVYGATGTVKLSVAWYDSSKSFISGAEQAGTGDVTNNETAPKNASYAKVSTDDYNFNTLFIAGNAPSEWAPSYADAKGNVNSANQLLKSLTDEQASVSASINANGNKKKTNVDNIGSMFVNGNLGSTDIGSLNGILTDISSDHSSDNSLATQYEVDISALNNYYGQLKDDINGLLGQAEGSSVDIDSYRAKLTDYYTNRDTFLQVVKGKIDSQVSSAKQALSDANNTANEVITNKYANFAITVDGISTKVGEVSETANNAKDAAKNAVQKFSEISQTANEIKQTVSEVTKTANSASSAASAAQASADSAASAASEAASAASETQQSLDALTDDGNISPIEKQTLAKDYAVIKSNKSIDLAQATKYSVSSTNYTNAETAVENLVNPILADMTTSTSVDRDSYKSTFSTYYDARTSLLNAVADVAKKAADDAQSAVDGLKNETTKKFSEFKQTTDAITSTVGEVTTTANNASDKINNLQVGGTNLVLGTANPVSIKGSNVSNEIIPAYDLVKPIGKLVTQAGSPITISFDYTIMGSLSGEIRVQYIGSTVIPMAPAGHVSNTVLADSKYIGSTATGIDFRLDNFSGTIIISNLKLELGNIATAWSPAPEDNLGIKSATTIYQLGDSGTTHPTGTWTESVPTLVKGMYLWTRTNLIYTDDSSEPIYSVTYIAKDGNNGADGLPGKDGVGIDSTVIEYAVSLNGVTKPTTGWAPGIPAVEPGHFLWTRTTWSYTDGTNEVGYSVAQAGLKGDKGDRGLQGLQGPQGDQGIQGPAGKPSYTHIAYGTSSSGAGLTQTPSASTTYIGMYVDFTATDSKDPKKYAWSLIKGADGAQGTPGKAGADGKTPYFHQAWADSSDGKTNFSTTASLGKKYLGTYTDYVVADSKDRTKYKWTELVGAIKIGGTNLYLNSKMITDAYGINSAAKVTVETFNSTTNMWHIVAAKGNGGNVGIYIGGYANGKIPNNSDWSYSADIKGTGKISSFGIENSTRNPVIGTVGSEWSRISQTGHVNETQTKTIIMYFDTTSSPLDVYIKLPKLELGNMPTAWSPAPEDFTSAVAAANANATNAQNSIDAMTNDNNISAIEKQTLAKEYATIKSNKTIDLAQASKYGVDATAYTTAETAVETLVNPLLTDMTTNSSVDRNSYKNIFSAYYDSRTRLLNAVADKAKFVADSAQSKIDGLKVGGRNILTDTGDYSGWMLGYGAVVNNSTSPGVVHYPMKTVTTGNTDDFLFYPNLTLQPSTTYTLSFNAWGKGLLTTYIYPNVSVTSPADNNKIWNLSATSTRYVYTFKTTASIQGSKILLFRNNGSASNSGLEAFITAVQIETGTIATDYTPALEDMQASLKSAAKAASDAKAVANTAKTNAANAKNSIDDMTNSNKISVIEKQTLAKDYATIKVNNAIDVAQAKQYGVDTTAYIKAEAAVEKMINPLLADMTKNSSVDRNAYKNTFTTYYNARTTLLNQVPNAINATAGSAKSTATTVQTLTKNNWGVLSKGLGGKSAGINVSADGNISLSGDHIIISGDLIAQDISGKNITGSTFGNTSGTFSIDSNGKIQGSTITTSFKGVQPSGATFTVHGTSTLEHGALSTLAYKDSDNSLYSTTNVSPVDIGSVLYDSGTKFDEIRLKEGQLYLGGLYKETASSDAVWKSGVITPIQLLMMQRCGLVLWSGVSSMNGAQSITPSLKLNECLNGWLLSWSGYNPNTGAVGNGQMSYTIIPKSHIVYGNAGTANYIFNAGVAGQKYIYASNTTLSGNDVNISKDPQKSIVLRAVYAF